MTFDGLCKAVAARIAGGALSAVMILMIWGKIRRIEVRIQALLTRFLAGRLRVMTAVRTGERGGRDGVRRTGARGTPQPLRFGWLLPMVPYEAACFAGQMRSTLATPEMVALLALSPQARRVLRPLCRMLGIEVEILQPAGAAPQAAEGPGACVPGACVPDGDETDRAETRAAKLGRKGAAVICPALPPAVPALPPQVAAGCDSAPDRYDKH